MMKTVFLSTSDRMIPLLEEFHKLTDLQFCITKKDVKIQNNSLIGESKDISILPFVAEMLGPILQQM